MAKADYVDFKSAGGKTPANVVTHNWLNEVGAAINDALTTGTLDDTSVSTLVNTGGTASQAAVDARVTTLAVGKGEQVINAADPVYGGLTTGTGVSAAVVTANTTALQAALNAADARGGAVVFVPAGWYRHEELVMSKSGVSLRGESDRATTLQNVGPSAGIVLGTTTVGVASLHFADIGFQNTGTGGHLMEAPYSLSQSKFERVRMISNNTAASLVYSERPGGSTGGGVFDTVWDGGYYKMPVTSTVHGFHFVGPESPANLLKWVGGRYEGGGTYMFHLEAGVGTYCYGNSWDGLNAEFPDKGFIRILSGLGNTIVALGIQDSGTITADLVYLGKSTAGPQSRGTTIIGYNRSKGTLSGGAVDIHNVAGGNAGSLTLAGITGPSVAGVTVDLGASAGWATLLGVDSTVAVLNSNTARTVTMDPSRGMVTPTLTLSGLPVTVSAVEPEGSVTAPVGSLHLCTSANGGLPKLWEKRTGTGNTGWRAGGAERSLPSSSFQSATHYVNTTGKYAGAGGFDNVLGRPIWAAGATAASLWKFADGTTAHTPV